LVDTRRQIEHGKYANITSLCPVHLVSWIDIIYSVFRKIFILERYFEKKKTVVYLLMEVSYNILAWSRI